MEQHRNSSNVPISDNILISTLICITLCILHRSSHLLPLAQESSFKCTVKGMLQFYLLALS